MLRFLLLTSLLFTSCKSIPLDLAMSAEEGGEATVVLCGAGEGCRKGLLFTQMNHGDLASGSVKIQTGKFNTCDKERPSCVRLQVIMPSGALGWAGSVGRDETEAEIPLSALIASEAITFSSDGEYLIAVKVWFKGPDGAELSTFGRAFFRLNVLEQSYQKIGCGDPEIAWVTPISTDCVAHYSTAFRSALCGSGCHD